MREVLSWADMKHQQRVADRASMCNCGYYDVEGAVHEPHCAVARLEDAESRIRRLEEERDRLVGLVMVAHRHLAAGDHDCAGPDDCWTCAANDVLAAYMTPKEA